MVCCAGPLEGPWAPAAVPSEQGELCCLAGVCEGEIVHYHAALLGDKPDGGLLRGLGAEALLAVSEHRAALVALGWLERQGRSRERIVLFTGSRPLAKREEEPFGLWRAT